MENQKMPEYETIRAAVAGEKWAVEKVVDCYKDEIDRLSTVAVRALSFYGCCFRECYAVERHFRG